MSATGAIRSEGRSRQSGQGRADGAWLPSAVSLTVLVPPSVNELFKNVRGKGRVKTKTYDDWRAAALTHIRLQAVAPISDYVLVIFGVERASLAADIDNRVKAMLDAIVKAKVISDDRMVTAFAVAWLPHANSLAHVQIMPVQPLTISFHPSNDRATGGWFITAPQPGEEDGSVHF